MLGLHLTADLHGCAGDPSLMREAPALRRCCEEAVARAGLTAVASLFHPFGLGPEGGPGGVTGVVLLAESHVAVHTWPEHGAVTLDVYVCNARRDNREAAERLLSSLVGAFAPQSLHRQRLRRHDLAQPATATPPTID